MILYLQKCLQFFLLTYIQQKVAVTLHKFTRKMVTMDIQQTLCHSKALLTSPLPTLVLTEWWAKS